MTRKKDGAARERACMRPKAAFHTKLALIRSSPSSTFGSLQVELQLGVTLFSIWPYGDVLRHISHFPLLVSVRQ